MDSACERPRQVLSVHSSGRRPAAAAGRPPSVTVSCRDEGLAFQRPAALAAWLSGGTIGPPDAPDLTGAPLTNGLARPARSNMPAQPLNVRLDTRSGRAAGRRRRRAPGVDAKRRGRQLTAITVEEAVALVVYAARHRRCCAYGLRLRPTAYGSVCAFAFAFHEDSTGTVPPCPGRAMRSDVTGREGECLGPAGSESGLHCTFQTHQAPRPARGDRRRAALRRCGALRCSRSRSGLAGPAGCHEARAGCPRNQPWLQPSRLQEAGRPAIRRVGGVAKCFLSKCNC